MSTEKRNKTNVFEIIFSIFVEKKQKRKGGHDDAEVPGVVRNALIG